MKYDLKIFIEKAKNIHKDKYDYSRVEYIDSKTKICIICPKHGEFWQTPANHLKGCGCPKCSFKKLSDLKLKTTNKFIEDAKNIHGDKYDYSKVEYKDNKTKVCIICPKHGEFWQNPNSHLQGCKCPKCSRENMPKKNNIDDFIKKAKNIHGDKYDYSETKYNGIVHTIKIKCPIHGEFYQKPYVHLMGCGCPTCSDNKKLTTEEFIRRSTEKHGDKYDYSKSKYINNRTKVIIICHKKDKNGIEHGEFYTTPHSHMQGSGCPKCKQNYRLENEVRLLLNKNNITFEEKPTLNGLKYKLPLKPDFYLPNEKIMIECQGEQHFKPINFGNYDKKTINKKFEENLIRDKIKEEYCKKNGIKLIKYTNLKIKDNNLIKSKEKLLKEIKYDYRRNKKT